VLKNTRLILLVMVSVLGIFVFFFSFRKIYSEDYFWHTETGRVLIEKGIPKTDDFSFTSGNAPIVNLSSLAQILFYSVGDSGTQILRSLLVVAMFVLSVFLIPFKKESTRFVVCLLSLFGVIAASSRFLCRPALFTDLLFIVFVFVLLRLQGTKLLMILVFLTALWINLHNGVLLAPVVVISAIFAVFLGRILKTEIEIEHRIFWLGLCLVCVFVAMFFNPYFADGAFYPFKFFTKPAGYILVLEWKSPLVELSDFFSPSLLSYKVLLALLVVSTVASYRKWRSFRIVLSGLVTLLSLMAYRNISLFALVAPPVIAANIEDALEGVNIPRLVESCFKYSAFCVIVVVSLIMSVFCATDGFWRSRHLYDISFGFGLSGVTFPLELPQFLKERPNIKRLFHNYELGGFLISRCERKSFLDGRLVHFPQEIHDDYWSVLSQPQRIDSVAEKWQLDGVILEHHRGRFDPLILHLYQSALWRLVYADSVVVLFERRREGVSSLAGNVEVLKGLVERFKKGDYTGSDYPEYDRETIIRLLYLLGESEIAASLKNVR